VFEPKKKKKSLVEKTVLKQKEKAMFSVVIHTQYIYIEPTAIVITRPIKTRIFVAEKEAKSGKEKKFSFYFCIGACTLCTFLNSPDTFFCFIH